MEQKVVEKIADIVHEDYSGNFDEFQSDLATNKKEITTLLKSQGVEPSDKDLSSKEVLISIQDLQKEYKVGTHIVKALNGVSLDIYKGEIVAIVGPSGSGKSTLLQIIGGLDQPSSGSIEVDGDALQSKNDTQLSDYRNNTIGFVFQSFYLQPYLDVQKNVELPMMFGKSTTKLRAERARDAVEAVGLTDRIDHLPRQLSGGQMQRVAIARAIVNNAKIILADEPTANLDKATTQDVISLLKKVRDTYNTSIVIVTHNDAVAKLADRIIKIEDGILQ